MSQVHHLPPLPPLPLDAWRGPVENALTNSPSFLLEAPPGTGKSTRVPLWALERLPGRILLLEPRRVAARMLAGHLADLTGTPLGGLVGLAMRRESRQSAATRLLVVTEGVLTRMLSEDPALEGVSCVLFDEFHERHLASDTGLALTLRTQELLRPDLHAGILSATLDSAALGALLPDAPVIRSEAPGFPVETRWLPAPGAKTPADLLRALPKHMALVITALLAEERGSLLAFLPGQGEIARTMQELEGRLPRDCDLYPLYGRLSAREQQAALAVCPVGRRKVVLATDVAETSLTIEGVRMVVDSGLQRRPHYDPRRGAQRLVTQAVPLSSADQRRGRAGRLEPGLCVRLWPREREQGMQPHARPEILEADLGPLALDLARWGEEPQDLPFVTQPPAGTYQAARHMLADLGALDGDGHITSLGRRMASMGLSPRSSAVLLACRDNEVCAAAVVCALLEEEQARAEGDLRRALELLLKNPHAQGREAVLSQAALMLARRARLLGQGQPAGRAAPGAGVLAAEALRVLADPFACGRLLLPGHADRLVLRGARARDRDMDTGHMRQGQGVLLPPAPDADTRFLLALETMLADTARAAGQSLAFGTVGLHCPVAEKDALAALGDRIVHERVCEVQESGSVLLREVTRLDALVLEERRAAPEAADGEVIRRALCGHVLAGSLACLPWTDAIERWLARLRFAAGALGDPWPVLDRATLAARQEEWLPGLLEGVTGLRAVTSDRLFQALRALVPWQCLAGLAEMAPDQWTSPAGRTHPVRYDEEQPCCEVKLQECFGLGSTPLLCGKVPLTLHLLSPGGARLASTRDLPFFWKEVYPSVRSEMRGRYPRHPWPEDPLTALPTALTQKALRARGLA